MTTKTTAEYIGEFVSLISETIIIKSQATNAGIITIQVDDTQWITIKENIIIDGKTFFVENLVFGESLDLKPITPGDTITVTSFVLSAPKYLHGNIKMTQNEVDAIADKRTLVPFVWLKELIRDQENFDDLSMIERSVQTRIFFINTSSFTDWDTPQHYELCIKPLNKLVNSFLGVIKNNRFVAEEINYIRTPHVNLSFERKNVSDDAKEERSIFDCDLDGVELDVALDLRKDTRCIKR